MSGYKRPLQVHLYEICIPGAVTCITSWHDFSLWWCTLLIWSVPFFVFTTLIVVWRICRSPAPPSTLSTVQAWQGTSKSTGINSLEWTAFTTAVTEPSKITERCLEWDYVCFTVLLFNGTAVIGVWTLKVCFEALASWSLLLFSGNFSSGWMKLLWKCLLFSSCLSKRYSEALYASTAAIQRPIFFLSFFDTL